MLLLTILLFLTALPDQSLGKEDEDEDEDDEGLPKGSGITLVNQQLIVDKHNEMRRNVKPTARNMLKMRWNERIGENAKKWAEKCLATSSPFEERMFDGVRCGETIYRSTSLYSWAQVIDYWRNQSSHFKYGVGTIDSQKKALAYTQAIWYRSYQIGCALAYCPKNKIMFTFICQYCHMGNIEGQINTPYKEGPRCRDCPKHCENGLCTNPCKYADHYTNCAEVKKRYTCKKANKDGHCKATCRCKGKIK